MSRDELIEKINLLIQEIAEIDPENLDPAKTPAEQGIDSIAMIEIATAVEADIDGLEIPEDDLTDALTTPLGQVYDMIYDRLAKEEV